MNILPITLIQHQPINLLWVQLLSHNVHKTDKLLVTHSHSYHNLLSQGKTAMDLEY